MKLTNSGRKYPIEIFSVVSSKELKAGTDISLLIRRERKLLSCALIECTSSLRKHPFLLALRLWGRFAAKSEEKRMFSQANVLVIVDTTAALVCYTAVLCRHATLLSIA